METAIVCWGYAMIGYIHIYIYIYLKPGSKAPCAGIGCRCSAGRRSNGWTLAGSCIDCTQPQAAATSGIDLQPYEISILIEHCAKENPWLSFVRASKMSLTFGMDYSPCRAWHQQARRFNEPISQERSFAYWLLVGDKGILSI